jgi:hypothetical protein
MARVAASKNLTPEQRSLRARIAGRAAAAQGKTNVKPARAAWLARFERQVDPDGTLPADVRAKRAHHAMKAHMTRMAFESSKARGRRKKAS